MQPSAWEQGQSLLIPVVCRWHSLARAMQLEKTGYNRITFQLIMCSDEEKHVFHIYILAMSYLDYMKWDFHGGCWGGDC